MTVKLGDVFEKENELYIVTHIINETIAETEKVDDYMMRHTTVTENSEDKR